MTADLVPEITPRELRWQDLTHLAAAEEELFGGEAWSLASWWGELAGRPRREYIVTEDEGGISGYAGLDHGGEVSDVMTIAVLPRARRAGLGRRLLRELMRRATQAGAQRLLLEVRADNEPARALYAADGFALVQTRRRYYTDGTDALVLSADLGDRSSQ